MLNRFRTLFLASSVLFTTLSFGAATTSTNHKKKKAKAIITKEVEPQEVAPREVLREVPIHKDESFSKYFSLAGNTNVYFGLILSNTATLNYSTTSFTTSTFVAEAALKSPGMAFGFECLPIKAYDFRMGVGFMYEFQRNFDTLALTTNSFNTVTYGNRTEQLKVSTLSALIQKDLFNNFSVIAGLNINFVSLAEDPSINWDLKSNAGVQIAGAYTFSNLRAQILYKTVSGNLTGTAKSFSNSNSTGTYNYNHLALTLGLLF